MKHLESISISNDQDEVVAVVHSSSLYPVRVYGKSAQVREKILLGTPWKVSESHKRHLPN